MFAVLARFEISHDKMQFFVPLVHATARASLENEPGCQQFDVLTDQDQPDVVVLYEIYDTTAAYDAHLRSHQFQCFEAQTNGMVTSKRVDTFAQVLR